MTTANPKTPVQKMWDEGRKKGLSDYDISTAITKRWPDTREVVFLIDNRDQRKVFTRFAQYMIREGLAINYRYTSKRELKDYTTYPGETVTARGTIEVIDRETPLPLDKLREIEDDVVVGVEVYDDDYIWPEENPRRGGVMPSDPPPSLQGTDPRQYTEDQQQTYVEWAQGWTPAQRRRTHALVRSQQRDLWEKLQRLPDWEREAIMQGRLPDHRLSKAGENLDMLDQLLTRAEFREANPSKLKAKLLR